MMIMKTMVMMIMLKLIGCDGYDAAADDDDIDDDDDDDEEEEDEMEGDDCKGGRG